MTSDQALQIINHLQLIYEVSLFASGLLASFIFASQWRW